MVARSSCINAIYRIAPSYSVWDGVIETVRDGANVHDNILRDGGVKVLKIAIIINTNILDAQMNINI